jgi:excisionase family DNA binding protein
MNKKKEYLKIKEAAEYLGVTTQTLRNWDKAGKFKAVRHPMNNYRVYRFREIENILQCIKKG